MAFLKFDNNQVLSSERKFKNQNENINEMKSQMAVIVFFFTKI